MFFVSVPFDQCPCFADRLFSPSLLIPLRSEEEEKGGKQLKHEEPRPLRIDFSRSMYSEKL